MEYSVPRLKFSLPPNRAAEEMKAKKLSNHSTGIGSDSPQRPNPGNENRLPREFRPSKEKALLDKAASRLSLNEEKCDTRKRNQTPWSGDKDLGAYVSSEPGAGKRPIEWRPAHGGDLAG
jgi:hypothetical protein